MSYIIKGADKYDENDALYLIGSNGSLLWGKKRKAQEFDSVRKAEVFLNRHCHNGGLQIMKKE